jgi:hypothetical protein
VSDNTAMAPSTPRRALRSHAVMAGSLRSRKESSSIP